MPWVPTEEYRPLVSHRTDVRAPFKFKLDFLHVDVRPISDLRGALTSVRWEINGLYSSVATEDIHAHRDRIHSPLRPITASVNYRTIDIKHKLILNTVFWLILGMEQYDLSGQRRDMKHKGRNVVWSIAMDKCLIETLAIQARNGNKIDKCFNENAYSAACIAVNTRFNLNLNNQKIINRLKTIKKRYKVIKDVLSQDGFRWNPMTKMVECENDDLWKRYVSAHPDARGLRGKPVEMLDELRIVCGNYQAPSRWAKMRDGSHPSHMKNWEDDSASFVSPSSEYQSETDDTESYTGQPEYSEMPNGNQDPPLVHPIRQLLKRPRESEALQDAMMALASSIRRLADAMEQGKFTIDGPELLQAVMQIDGLEEGKQMYAFEYLNADPVKARAFMTYNPRMRKMYLFRQFWWWK